MSDIDTIRERHFPVAPKPDKGGEPDVCLTCDEDWPCDTRVVLDALDSKTEIARAGIRLLDIEMDLHRATKVDADRLAEALRKATHDNRLSAK